MPKINYVGSGHGRLTIGGDRWWEYTNPRSQNLLQDAFELIVKRSLGSKRCNDCFKRLKGGRTFEEVWKDESIWVSYDSRTDRDWFGITDKVGGKEISISQETFDKGVEWVAGTLVHELAHTNGASGATADADATLLECDFKAAYQNAIGQRLRLPVLRIA